MAFTWTLYLTDSVDAGRRAIERAHAELETLLGADRTAALKSDDYDDDDELGSWPELEAVADRVPTVEAERAALDDPKKSDVLCEQAALKRLGTCRSQIDVLRPRGFEDDPALVTAMRSLLKSVGPAVFCEQRGFHLITSETLAAKLGRYRDLAAAIEDAEEEEDEGAPISEEDAPVDEGAKPAELRRMLGFIADDHHARRRAGHLLTAAPELVNRLAGSLARDGVASEAELALRLKVTPAELAAACTALARIIDRVGR